MNENPICNLKFLVTTLKKKQVKVNFKNIYLNPYIKNIVISCNP